MRVACLGRVLRGTMNHIYDPINAVKIIVGIEIANDIFNESMSASTAIGQLYGIGSQITSKLYQVYIENNSQDKPDE